MAHELDPACERQLAVGIQALALDIDAMRRQKLLDYLALLAQWNRAYNLTAVRDVRAMVDYHLLDSLSVLAFIQHSHVLDVGTGAGLPGLVIAMAQPHRRVTVLDSNGKKTRFCTHAAGVLGLENVAVVRQRIKDYRPVQSFGSVVSRAFSRLGAFVDNVRHVVADDGQMLAMKGTLAARELAGVPEGFEIKNTHALSIPGIDGERHIVEIMRA